MYYKDDFYKEFRTEKELCEYLEEIDSRAEWIRVTSKKLKVAAAGEETCTEVPGHFPGSTGKKDTLSHSRLVRYPAREDLLYRKFSNQIVERTGQD